MRVGGLAQFGGRVLGCQDRCRSSQGFLRFGKSRPEASVGVLGVPA